MMPRFSKKSQANLASCHSDLQRLFNHVIKYDDCTILEGHRSEERQNKLFADGKSQLKFPKGKHNATPSRAVDVAPYPIDFKDTERFCLFAGKVMVYARMMGIPIRWGGDWNMDGKMRDETFKDFCHWELL